MKRSLVAFVVAALPAPLACSSETSPTRSSQTEAVAEVASASTQPAAGPVSATAWPNADCVLYPSGLPSDSLDVFADDLGIAHFVAVHASPGDSITSLTLDCHDNAGRTGQYSIDLTSPDTFQTPPPPPPDQWPAGSMRPALTGDPMQFSEKQLLDMGFGMRPDPTKAPEAFARWLTTTTTPARRSMAKGHNSNRTFSHSASTLNWGGGLLEAQTCCFRQACVYCENFVLSELQTWVPYAALLSNSEVVLWGGLGGYGVLNPDANSLIQDGLFAVSNGTGTAMVYEAWIEYFSGTGVGGPGYATALDEFSLNPGDYFYAQAWACDSSGNRSLTGGYGCFYMYDGATGVYVTCSTPNGSCPSLAEINTFYGYSAEGVAEKIPGKSVPNFGSVTAYLDAWDSAGTLQEFSNDSNQTWNLTLINGHGQTLVSTSLNGADGETLQWVQSN